MTGRQQPSGASVSSVEIEHRFDAPLDVVWRAWTDPERVSRWWGSDPDGVVTSAELDVRVGGRFEISFRDPSGDAHTSRGEYLRVEEPRVLDFTWSWESEPGAQSRVTVELARAGDATAMRFVHGELVGVSAHDYAPGWRRTFGKLDAVLADER
ncbi:SRPBCC domain-containing protein [Luteimicrobium sp. NPDC057192]|uniref:SRPBCC family protein n=1 Tax=Luteimicrobium sp. NPDC057192 TaxID=3346042 RepID=UPI00362C00B8